MEAGGAGGSDLEDEEEEEEDAELEAEMAALESIRRDKLGGAGAPAKAHVYNALRGGRDRRYANAAATRARSLRRRPRGPSPARRERRSVRDRAPSSPRRRRRLARERVNHPAPPPLTPMGRWPSPFPARHPRGRASPDFGWTHKAKWIDHMALSGERSRRVAANDDLQARDVLLRAGARLRASPRGACATSA